MLLIFCFKLRKVQLYGKPGKYFLARGPVRLGLPRAPMQVKMALQVTLCDPVWHVSSLSREECCKLLYSVHLYILPAVLHFA